MGNVGTVSRQLAGRSTIAIPNIAQTQDDSSLPSNDDQEAFSIVWFHPNIYNDQNIQKAIKYLQENVQNVVQITDSTLCARWVKHRPANENIVFLVSYEYEMELVPQVHHFLTVTTIYVYYMDRIIDNSVPQTHWKVRQIVFDVNNIAEQISNEIADFEDRKNFKNRSFISRLSLDYGIISRAQLTSEKKTDAPAVPRFAFQFILIDITQHLNQAAAVMLKSLTSLAEGTILHFDSATESDLANLPKKTTYLFTSSQFAAKLKSKPAEIHSIFILESDKKKVDGKQHFGTGEDLISTLANKLVECYKKKAEEYKTFNNAQMHEKTEKQANNIELEMKKLREKILPSYAKTEDARSPLVTTFVWLQLKNQSVGEIAKMKDLFSEMATSFLVYENEAECKKYILDEKVAGTVFLVIAGSFKEATIAEYRRIKNVKVVYWYGKPVVKNDKMITDFSELYLRLAHDVRKYYNGLSDGSQDEQITKIAKTMFLKARTLCDILGDV